MRKSFRRQNSGFTLLEVLVAGIILMIGLVMIGTHIRTVQKTMNATQSSITMNQVTTPLAKKFYLTSSGSTGSGNVTFDQNGNPGIGSRPTKPTPGQEQSHSQWSWQAVTINQKETGVNFSMMMVSDKKSQTIGFTKPVKK